METSRKLQIGVMGSCSDLNYAREVEKVAQEIGAEIAKSGAVLVFGAEQDVDSLSSAACRGAKSEGGITVGVTYNKGKNNIVEENADIVIATGLERGGGRELCLVLSCDGIITLQGGSGTLTEIAIAYQADIPIVAIPDYGGWSQRLAGEYLDGRRRREVVCADSAKDAVKKIIRQIRKGESDER